MSSLLYLSIPCTFENKVLIIKGLGLTSNGDNPEEALLECIKGTGLYMSLMLSNFKAFTDFRGRDFMALEVPYHEDILNTIHKTEPFPKDKIKLKKNSNLIDASPEETLKHGY